MSVNLFLISLHKKNLSFYYLFFNYSNYCYFTYFLTFVIEFFLIIYILYYFIFYDEVCINFKKLFFQYLFFLCFLISILYFILLENTTIICFHLISTKYIIYCKLIIIILLLLTLLINYNKFIINPKEIGFKELPILLSFLLLFICILLASCDFFVIYLVIEGISLILYSLGSLMNKSLINLEAIIKYFLINNMASTCLLWSISYVYILTGTTDCFDLQYILISTLETVVLEQLYPICFFLILSLLFKLAIFPFHWWVADIYEGLWTPVTLCYAVLIKITFFLFFFKLILTFFYSLLFLLEFFFIFCCLGSIILGSLGALIQVKIKRFLAYTSIAQSGYIIIGLASNSLNGFISALLYLFMYCIITLSFFALLVNLEQLHKGYNISYLNQLYSIILYNKEVALHFIIIILVMAAIPPFSSFFVKLLVFLVSIEAQLAIITIFFLSFSLLSTLYYLTFIQQLLFLKFNNGTITLFLENSFNIQFLRICSVFFCFSFLFLSDIYNFLVSLLLAGLWPLTN